MGKTLPVNNTKYKSKICTTFADRLFCPYGQRCLFKHEDRSFDQIKQYYYVHKLDKIVGDSKTIIHDIKRKGYSSRISDSRRLKIFNHICSIDEPALSNNNARIEIDTKPEAPFKRVDSLKLQSPELSWQPSQKTNATGCDHQSSQEGGIGGGCHSCDQNNEVFFTEEEDTNFSLFLNQLTSTGYQDEAMKGGTSAGKREFLNFEYFRSNLNAPDATEGVFRHISAKDITLI